MERRGRGFPLLRPAQPTLLRRLPSLPLALFVLILLCLHTLPASAQPATVPFQECEPTSATEPDPSKRINITTIYAQHLQNDPKNRSLKLTMMGEVGSTLQGSSNETLRLATIFTSTTFLTFVVNETSSSLCESLRPPSPLPELPVNVTHYCPIDAGPLAIGFQAALDDDYNLATLVTRIRIVDSSAPALELACLDVSTTYLDRGQNTGPIGIYGIWGAIFWGTVGLAAGYWVVTGIARMSAAWDRGLGRSDNPVWFSAERMGFVLASALSGEKFASSPALLRFATPSARDILLHTQWCAALAMVAVQWPDSIYPILSNTAWSTLVFNVSLIQGENADSKHWNPLAPLPFEPSNEFLDQINNAQSPLYLDTTATNSLLSFPEGAGAGIPRFAAAVGLRPQDLWGTCLALFLLIVAGTIVISTLIMATDWVATTLLGSTRHGYSTDRKDAVDQDVRRPWWKRRLGTNSFHGSVLHGNLVRLLVVFHFPVTVYSCYHFTLDDSLITSTSRSLAALSFAILSVIIPAWLLFRITTISTNKLYDATRTLLAYGPLYNEYQPSSHVFVGLFFAANVSTGIAIGCGQRSGTAQAIIVLVVEVIVTLSTSIWLPWMHGAQMGVISFLFCVAKIITAVLMVILSPPVNIGHEAGGWIAYTIAALQGIIFAAFALMLFVKILEGLVRIIRQASFSDSRHGKNSGLFGALGWFGSAPKQRQRQRGTRHSSRRGAPSTYSASTTRSTSHALPHDGFLKPEHASMRYKEDSDEEAGFIMSAWKPDTGSPHSTSLSHATTLKPSHESTRSPRSKKSILSDSQHRSSSSKSATPTQDPIPLASSGSGGTGTATSGFSRVGGGRAHHETPWAILQKGTSAPQFGRSAANPAPQSQYHSHFGRSSPAPASPHTTPAASAVNPPLPRGAKPPFHARTRSQTAVIEDASALRGAAVSPKTPSSSRPGSAGKSRPSSSGRPASAGKGQPGSSSSRTSRPGSSSGLGRPPSRISIPAPPTLQPSELGVMHSSGAGPSNPPTAGPRTRGWFGLLGGGGGGDSSSSDDDDEEDDDESKGSQRTKRGGLWTFGRKRRKSESDMTPAPTPGVTTESRSFVVLRPNQTRVSYDALSPPATISAAGAAAMERNGSIAVRPSASSAALISTTPLSPDAESIRMKISNPPSSYLEPPSRRRMSNPTM